jgi:hypothetical protein
MVRGSLRTREPTYAPSWTLHDLPLSQRVIAELNDKFPDYCKTHREDGLRVGVFADLESAHCFLTRF